MSGCSSYFRGMRQSLDVALQLLGRQVNSQITGVESVRNLRYRLHGQRRMSETGLLLSQGRRCGAMKLVVEEKERNSRVVRGHGRSSWQDRPLNVCDCPRGGDGGHGETPSMASSVFDKRAVSKIFSKFRDIGLRETRLAPETCLKGE